MSSNVQQPSGALNRFLNEQGYYSENTNRDVDKG